MFTVKWWIVSLSEENAFYVQREYYKVQLSSLSIKTNWLICILICGVCVFMFLHSSNIFRSICDKVYCQRGRIIRWAKLIPFYILVQHFWITIFYLWSNVMQWMHQLMMFPGQFNPSFMNIFCCGSLIRIKNRSISLSFSLSASHIRQNSLKVFQYSSGLSARSMALCVEYSVSSCFYVMQKMCKKENKTESMFKIAPRDFWSTQSTKSDTKVSHVTPYLTSVLIYQEEKDGYEKMKWKIYCAAKR